MRWFMYTTFFLLLSCNMGERKPRKPKSASEPLVTYFSKDAPTVKLFENDKYVVEGQKGTKVKIVKASEVSQYPNMIKVDNFEDDVLLKNFAQDSTVVLKIKFNQKYEFSDFEVTEFYQGTPRKPLLNSHPLGEKFGEKISLTCEKTGVNFAGKYTIVSFGQGTGVRHHAIVDRSTGIIIAGFDSYLPIEFYKNSGLIINNKGAVDFRTNYLSNCPYCKIEYLQWTGEELIKL